MHSFQAISSFGNKVLILDETEDEGKLDNLAINYVNNDHAVNHQAENREEKYPSGT